MAWIRARLVIDRARMESETILDQERVEHVRKQITIQNEFVDRLGELAEVHRRAEEKLNQIPDSSLREEIRRSFGQVASIDSANDPSNNPKP